MKKKNKNNYIKKLHANKYPNKRKAVCKGQLRENPSRNKKVTYKVEGDINEGYLSGKLRNITFSYYSADGEKFVETCIYVPRNSDNVDVIPVLFSEKMYQLYKPQLYNGRVTLIGSFRSEKRLVNNQRTIFHYFRPHSIDFDDKKYKQRNNSLHLCGTISQQPIMKEMKENNIYYFKLAVNAPNLNNYIPVYARARTEAGQIVKNLQVGDRIEILGRAQSRQYHIGQEKFTTVKEVSIGKVNSVEYLDSNCKIVYNNEEE